MFVVSPPVEQDDLLYPNFSVRETIEFATKLRLSGSKYNASQKKKRVEDVIHILRLGDVQDTHIGGPLTRGVSGGERKRVSIGIELVTDPNILFLDEPTSGLDSNAALRVVDTLLDVARSQKVGVVLTIHQPSARLLYKFHKLILLAKGKHVYNGPVAGGSCIDGLLCHLHGQRCVVSAGVVDYFSKIGYPCPPHENPADYFVDLMTVDLTSAAEREASEVRIKRLQDAWEEESGEKAPEEFHFAGHSASTGDRSIKDRVLSHFDANKKRPNNWFYELAIVTRRGGLETMRNKIRLFAGAFQSIFLGMVIGFSFFRLGTSQASIQNRAGLLFFISIELVSRRPARPSHLCF